MPFVLLSVLFFLSVPLYAQVGEAQLSGVVADPTGAVVPGALIGLVDQETHREAQTVSGPAGNFIFFPLRPGTYTASVEAMGFQRLLRKSITISTGEHIHLDFQLHVGAAEESITVTADAPLLRADSANLGQVVDNQKIRELPLNGRSFIALTQLAPGVALPPNSTLPRINGGRPRTNEYLYDGISVLQPEPGQVAFTPIIDAIQEFKVETNNPSAEFGRFNGGVINLTMKSGTNDFHGSVFDFLRNEGLNARNAFAPATTTNPGKPLFRRNQYGFVLGGPITRDKTFFFLGYQGTRQRIGRVRTSTVPTLLQRQGIFTEAVGGSVPRIYDPGTTRTDASGVIIRDPFPLSTIPQDRMDSAARILLSRYPVPTSTGTANNYTRIGNETDNQDQADIRIDHRFGSQDRIFARISYLVDIQDPVTPLPEGSGVLTTGAVGHTRSVGVGIASSYVHSFGGSVTNELRAGYTKRNVRLQAAQLAGPASTILGIPGIPDNPSFPTAMPTFAIAGYQQLGPSTSAYSRTRTDLTQFADTLAFQHRTHFFKTGMDFRWERMDIVQPPSPSGSFSFSAAETGTPASSTSGSALASFLLGQVDRFTIDVQQNVLRPRALVQEFFLQDDWKASQRLTVTAGVRYTLNFPSTEAANRGAVFNLQTEQLDYTGRNGFPRSARELHKLNLGPRFGLAYSATGNTVVRAGYGIVWIEQTGITTPFTIPYFPFVQTVSQRTLDDVNPAFILSNGPEVASLLLTPDAALGQGAFAVDRGLGSGYVQQWNFSVQRELTSNVVFELAYTGSKITHVGIPDTNLNQLTVNQLALGSKLLQQVPNPYFGIIPRSSSLGTPTLPLAQLLKPYARFTNISLFRNNVGNTNYNAFQVKLEKRLSSGLTVLGSYTRSRLIDEASSVFDASIITGPTANFPVADTYNRRLERDVSTGDIPNVFVASAIYDIPVGRQHRLFSSGLSGAILAGWQIAAIVSMQSGIPLAVTQATNFNSFGGFGIQRPNRIRSPELPASERTTAKYFDTSAFTVAPQFTIGNSSRNPVRGPGFKDADIALVRRIPIGERKTIDARAEIFNLTNTPPWGAPNTVLGAAGFGTITSAGDPRVIQLALKVTF